MILLQVISNVLYSSATEIGRDPPTPGDFHSQVLAPLDPATATEGVDYCLGSVVVETNHMIDGTAEIVTCLAVNSLMKGLIRVWK